MNSVDLHDRARAVQSENEVIFCSAGNPVSCFRGTLGAVPANLLSVVNIHEGDK